MRLSKKRTLTLAEIIKVINLVEIESVEKNSDSSEEEEFTVKTKTIPNNVAIESFENLKPTLHVEE